MAADRARAPAIALAACLLLSVSPAIAADCFGGLRDALERGGYTPMDCNDVDQTVKYVGRTKSAHGVRYYVYQLSYRTKTHGWGVSHGGDRILIFDASRSYLGHYHLDFGQKLRIEGADVVFDYPAKNGNRIHLDGPSPPETAWIDEDVIGFGK